MKHTLIVLAALIVANCRAIHADDEGHRVEPKPNILLITCDNLGYGDLPCFNPKTTVKSPCLDLDTDQ